MQATVSATSVRIGWLPHNGSLLSCGRPARRRKVVGRHSVPARAQHYASFRAITARQLQALVRLLTHLPQITPRTGEDDDQDACAASRPSFARKYGQRRGSVATAPPVPDQQNGQSTRVSD